MKYIFIDSNQYRHLFSRYEGFSESVYKSLMKLIEHEHARLLLPQQTKDEVERNRCSEWPESEIKSIDNKVEKLSNNLEKARNDFADFSSLQKLESDIQKQIKGLQKKRTKVTKDFSSIRSKPNQKLKKLFQKANIITETPEIQTAANLRHQKGNPPYDRKNIGDALIWESLIQHLKQSRGAHLVFVANDNEAWGAVEFNRFLRDEYKEKVKGKISYSKKLSDIPDLTAEEQTKIRKEELENLKQNAINDFVDSPSFIEAGARVQRLLQFKDNLTNNDFKEILQASITNHEIFQSFFTVNPLLQLVSGENGYVKKEIEGISEDLWGRFSKKLGIELKRQTDQQLQAVDDKKIDINNTPL